MEKYKKEKTRNIDGIKNCIPFFNKSSSASFKSNLDRFATTSST